MKLILHLDRQNKQIRMLTIQKIVGVTFEKLSVVFKNPFAAMPVIIARIKYIYPDNKLIFFILLLQTARRL